MIELNVTKNTNTAIPGTAGLYYPRVEYKGTLEMKDLAKLLSKHSTTFTQGEMIGVLTDAAQLIKEKILDGYVVKIEDLGLFGFIPAEKLQRAGVRFNHRSRRFRAGRGHAMYKCGDIVYVVLDSLDFVRGRAVFRPV